MSLLDNHGFDLWADGYDASVEISDQDNSYPFAGYRDVLARVYATVRRAHPTGHILDLGIGTATLSARLAGDGYAITGLDFSERMLAIAQAKVPTATLLQADLAAPLPDTILAARYDAIIATYALHHLPDDAKLRLLKTLYPLLTPGGVLVIGDISFENPDTREAVASTTDFDPDEYYYDYQTLRPHIAVPSRYAQISHCAGVLTLKKPRMVIFDYGDTLGEVTFFETLKGYAALMAHATKNPDNLTVEEVHEYGEGFFWALDNARLENMVEIHYQNFLRMALESLGIELDIPLAEQERVFRAAAAVVVPLPGIRDWLACLAAQGIRSGVISNIMYSYESLKGTIDDIVPDHAFEFIIATSEYVMRKPHPMIFELGLRKAGLPPEDVWYCGDNYVCDVEGSSGVGITPIWITKTPDARADNPGVTTIGGWNELTAWMGCSTIGN